MGLFVGVSNPLEVSLLTGAIGASGVLSIWSVGDLASFAESPLLVLIISGFRIRSSKSQKSTASYHLLSAHVEISSAHECLLFLTKFSFISLGTS